MTTANVQAMVVGLTLHDVPLRYQTPKGPQITFELYYSHRDALQPAIFTYTNFGPKWTSNWISYLTDNTATTGTSIFTCLVAAASRTPSTALPTIPESMIKRR